MAALAWAGSSAWLDGTEPDLNVALTRQRSPVQIRSVDGTDESVTSGESPVRPTNSDIAADAVFLQSEAVLVEYLLRLIPRDRSTLLFVRQIVAISVATKSRKGDCVSGTGCVMVICNVL